MNVLECGKLLKMEDRVAVEDQEKATLSYSIRGYVYRAIWSAALGEILQCERELDNVHDCYTVCVMRHGTIIGHIISSTTNFSRMLTISQKRRANFLQSYGILTIFILIIAADGTANDSWPFGSGVPFISFKNQRMDIT